MKEEMVLMIPMDSIGSFGEVRGNEESYELLKFIPSHKLRGKDGNKPGFERLAKFLDESYKLFLLSLFVEAFPGISFFK